jgi:PPOX class probable FMN-dependent enzyme
MARHFITDREGLAALYAKPSGLALGKQLAALDGHARAFIERAPLLLLGTSADVSPKGDAPGFVRVIDEVTLVIPDRRGNNRLDSLINLLDDPRVGLLFMIPGIDETLRVNGTARITTDPELLAPLAVNGKVPVTALLVTIAEVFLHCAKAFRRARLWDPAAQISKSELTHPGRAMAEQGGTDPEEGERSYDEKIATAMAEEGRV